MPSRVASAITTSLLEVEVEVDCVEGMNGTGECTNNSNSSSSNSSSSNNSSNNNSNSNRNAIVVYSVRQYEDTVVRLLRVSKRVRVIGDGTGSGTRSGIYTGMHPHASTTICSVTA